ncbi:MAG: hypothetical protein BRD45_06095 [Bacteroidetes bacterium QS_8_64_10]|nr:MAG: hypothetical protein BRD45_06095 [Bacteroidetes bacterium QS_8_64_10]
MTREELTAHLEASEARLEGVVSEVKAEARASREANEALRESLKHEVAEAEKRVNGEKNQILRAVAQLRESSEAEEKSEILQALTRVDERITSLSSDLRTTQWVVGAMLTLGILIMSLVSFLAG